METNVPVRMHPNIEQAMANELMMTTKLRNGKRPRTTKREGRRVISPVRPFVDCVPYRFFPSSGTRRLDPHRSQGLRHLDLRDEHRAHRAAGERRVATACTAGGLAALRPQPPFRLASLHPGWLAVDLSHSTQLRVRSLRSTTATYAPQAPIAASRCITPSSG